MIAQILYTFQDDIDKLLANVRRALPPGGRLIISEPMSGGARPDPATDVYFTVYTLAMQTGRTRSAAEIAGLLQKAGFEAITPAKSLRPFVTTALSAIAPAESLSKLSN